MEVLRLAGKVSSANQDCAFCRARQIWLKFGRRGGMPKNASVRRVIA